MAYCDAQRRGGAAAALADRLSPPGLASFVILRRSQSGTSFFSGEDIAEDIRGQTRTRDILAEYNELSHVGVRPLILPLAILPF